MAIFNIRTVNSTFATNAQTEFFSEADDALAHGVRGAMMIGSEEINQGAQVVAIEVIVEDEAGQQVRRCAVSVSVASLALLP